VSLFDKIVYILMLYNSIKKLLLYDNLQCVNCFKRIRKCLPIKCAFSQIRFLLSIIMCWYLRLWYCFVVLSLVTYYTLTCIAYYSTENECTRYSSINFPQNPRTWSRSLSHFA